MARSHALVLAALLLAGASAVAAYTCDSSTCKAPNCMCASTDAPGGLAPKDTPQFVLITHDDSVNALSNRLMRTVTDGFKNPNGCNVPATWFTLQVKTNCTLVKQLIKDNHEIAGHTVNHVRLSKNMSVADMEAEVAGLKKWMIEECGVPEDKFLGFRAPYLVHNEQYRNVLAAAGYSYDSTLLEPFNSITSPSFSKRVFPYTMDAGIPQDCAWAGDSEGSCTATERHPGVWEVPLWILSNKEGLNTYSMDPVADTPDALFELLKKNFDEAYNGNRAPFPLYVHSPWFTWDNTEAALKFMEYATSKPDVWFVTMSQLIEWMKNPVPASQVGNQMTCNMVELKAPTVEYCRQYKVGPIEDVWTVAGRWGVAIDQDIIDINPKLPKWNIPEGYIVNLPPWDARCEKPGAAFFADSDWYKPVYTEKQWTPVSAPAPAPTTTETTETTPADTAAAAPSSTTTTTQAPTAAAPTTAPAASTTAPAATPAGNGAAAPAGSLAALLLAGVAALCLLF